MALPFKIDPEPPKRPAEADPFLEFESERPGMRLTVPAREPLIRPEVPERSDYTFPVPAAQPPAREKSAISPALAFGLGVAGLVAAGMAYFQLGQFLSQRSAAPNNTAATQSSVPPGATDAGKPGPSSRGIVPAVPRRGGTSRVDVASNPPGAVVSLDGSARGVTPIVLSGLSAGTHEIVITRGGVSVSRTIELAEGEARVVSAHLPGTAGGRATATVAPSRSSSGRPIVASEPAASNQGWVNFETPLDLQVFSDGRLIGNTRSGRIALPAGSHDLLLASTQLEYRHMVSVTAQTGRTVASVVPVATGLLSVNALPWAEVSVDGTSVGTTPLANLSLPIGTHEVVWRHPTLGDRRQTVVVKAKTPARIGVDLSRDR